MTEVQLLVSLKAELVAQTWTGSSTVVFPTGSVKVTGSVEESFPAALKTQRVPIALIQPGATEADPGFDEDPSFVRFGIVVRLATMVLGDAIGENAVLGGYKVNGSQASEGRGIYELEQELWNAIGKLNALESIVLQNRFKSATGQAYVEGVTKVLWRDYAFEAMVTMV